MPNHNAAVPSPELVDKETKVLELRRAGLTWQRIAQEVGYADHSGAYAAYKRAIKRTQQQPADELREQELDRIDRLQLAAWPKAMQGHVQSIAVICRLMERRARLLGLDMPIKIEQDVTTWEGGDSIDRAVRDLANLFRLNAQNSSGESAVAGDTSQAESTAAIEAVVSMANLDWTRLGQDQDGSGVVDMGSDNKAQDEMGSSR